jgi:GPH family glycoside/pentoside/hexuronide:cation symporter
MILSLLFWKKRIETRGKKKTLIEVFMTAIIVLPFSLLGFFSFSTSLLFAIPYVILVAISLGGWYLFPYIIYADIAEDDQKKTGELKAGIYSGFPAIILNIFQALSLRFTGWILSLRNIVNVPETDGFSIGLILWGPIASIILIISLIYAKKFIKLDFKWEKKKN